MNGKRRLSSNGKIRSAVDRLANVDAANVNAATGQPSNAAGLNVAKPPGPMTTLPGTMAAAVPIFIRQKNLENLDVICPPWRPVVTPHRFAPLAQPD